MGTTSVSPAAFTGSSSFSSDLQQVITRAVGIASLPIQQLQTEQSSLNSQQSGLQSLTTDVSTLNSALSGLSQAAGSGAYSAAVSNPSLLSASLTSPSGGGSYAVNVTSLGSQTNTVSVNGLNAVTDPSSSDIDSASSFTLTVNGNRYTVNNPGQSLNGLAQAINQSGANVQATVVNVGSSGAPDYRLSVQSANYAPDAIQLSDGSTNLLQTISTGSYVTYQVDGQPTTPINSTSRTFTISPGLSVTALSTGSSTVSVSQSASNLSSALSSFVTAYNTVLNDVSKSRGQNGGPLSGQPIITTIGAALDNIAGYDLPQGAVQSLADLGITFDTAGHLQFDPSTLSSASNSSLSSALAFLGTGSSGGFLQYANSVVSSLSDPSTGALTVESNSVSSQLSGLAQKISADQDQVNQLQQSLTNQMAQADATISTLEQQVSEVTNLFTAMQQASKSLNGG
jgi:flagellar hook-associated protein 2